MSRDLGTTNSGLLSTLEAYHKQILADYDKDVSDVIENTFASRYAAQDVPKDRLPDEGMPSRVAYQLIHDIRQLDANPRLNLASFVTTWMEPEAEQLIKESLDVNYVDMDQYKSSTDIQNRCVKMLANLWNAPPLEECDMDGCGTATIGSSEAIMLAGLALKMKWKQRRQSEGKDCTKPNLVMGYNVQVCWEKFCRYFDVEERFVPLEEGCYCLTAEKARGLIDENTIGVCVILGSTYNGEFENVEEVNDMLEEVNSKTGWDVPIHVDGASGAWIASFLYPDLPWDFRSKWVVSINASGHKYGLVYPGLGWVVWRNRDVIPDDLIFWVNYLGTDQASITLNFSKSASMIIAQYYQFLRLGASGYRHIFANLKKTAKRLAQGIERTGHFKVLSNDVSVPLVAFQLNKSIDMDGKEHTRAYDEFALSNKLRERGWVLPAYSMAPNAQHVTLLRAVVREDMSMQMVDALVRDIEEAVAWLDSHIILTTTQVEALKQEFRMSRIPSAIYRLKQNGVC